MEPVQILFYGGPWHGRKQYVSQQQQVVVNSMPKRPLFREIGSLTDVPSSTVSVASYNTTVYEMRKIGIVTPSNTYYGFQQIEETARVMMPVGKEYDYEKVWRMMKRYKCMALYQRNRLDMNGRPLL